jgi:catechol 2,3-dioxygenase-like lactoylglutathione lyase family enzyme
MIHGAHFLIYSDDAEADRAFLRDVLGLRAVDAGHGWLIFALPPAEVAVHPAGEGVRDPIPVGRYAPIVLYLMCDDVGAEVAALAAKGVECAKVEEEDWGLSTSFALPGGGRIGLYQPLHPTALG